MNDNQNYETVVRGEPSKGDIRKGDQKERQPLELTVNWIQDHFKVLPTQVATPIGKYNHDTGAVHEDNEVNFRSPDRVMKEAEKIAGLMDHTGNDTSVENEGEPVTPKTSKARVFKIAKRTKARMQTGRGEPAQAPNDVECEECRDNKNRKQEDVVGMDLKAACIELNKAYNIVANFKRNLFMIPAGKNGRRLVSKISEAIGWFSENDARKHISWKAAIVIPALLLQQPRFKTSAKENAEILGERMGILEEGGIGNLVEQAEAIQKKLKM